MKIDAGQPEHRAITTIGNRPPRSIRPTEVFLSLIGVVNDLRCNGGAYGLGPSIGE
jgi:hypothetical protein